MKLFNKPLPVYVLVIAPWLLAHLLFYTGRNTADPMYSYCAAVNFNLSTIALLLGVFGVGMYVVYAMLKDFSWQAAGIAYTIFLSSCALSTLTSLISANIFVSVMKHAHTGSWPELSLLALFFFLGHHYFHHCEYVGECICRWSSEKKKLQE